MKFFKYLGVGAIMLFSFYYTDKIANFVLEKNTLYQEINNVKDNFKTKSVSAIIDNNYIIPGLNGSEVAVKDSYYNMKSLDAFNEYYLVFNETFPEISLENNKDKIIKKGNSQKRNVAFIMENDEALKEFFAENNLKANILVTLEDYSQKNNFEPINNDFKNYEKIESLLNNASLNKNLCVVNNNIIDICRKKEKYLIEPSILNNTTFLNIKNNLSSGDIFLVKKGTNLANLKMLIKDINFQDLKIVYLSELISESK